MNSEMLLLFSFVENWGVLAPLAFILFHVLRQFLFLPVILVCMAGGVLFGSLLGTIYSLVGLTLLSSLFFIGIHKFPRFYEKLLNMKNKWFGPHARLTIGQITVLRLIPFVHFQLLNLCLLERKKTFKKFIKSSFLTNLPLAFFYTVFGQFIAEFTPGMVILILLGISVLFYVLREKVTVMKWKEFFPVKSS
ncbi:TVP38/TMEM64 family protein [Bacillus sp. 2205SS5-2]|uniref:TVP38/TMEM64 family protein n=1 Tax=Bacillus sp. 2205SS5-2 TaxID=3109031 RepID=UPI00300521F1